VTAGFTVTLPNLVASILVVCTGNVCRSPIAEAILRSTLGQRLGERAPAVASAGTSGWSGSLAEEGSIVAAAERGFDLSAHRGRRLQEDDLADAALVIAMSSEHRDHIEDLHPGAAGRTFTLKELVRLLERLPPRERSTTSEHVVDPDATVRELVARADARRRAGDRGNPADEGVIDPLGMPLATYRAVAAELEEWCLRLVDAMFGPAPVRAASLSDPD
jgi:protein-tyrosine phosphatase